MGRYRTQFSLPEFKEDHVWPLTESICVLKEKVLEISGARGFLTVRMHEVSWKSKDFRAFQGPSCTIGELIARWKVMTHLPPDTGSSCGSVKQAHS